MDIEHFKDRKGGDLLRQNSFGSSSSIFATQSTRRDRERTSRRYLCCDDVLARLLELNELRHKEELGAGSSQSSAKSKKKNAKQSKPVTKRVNNPDQAPQQELF